MTRPRVAILGSFHGKDNVYRRNSRGRNYAGPDGLYANWSWKTAGGAALHNLLKARGLILKPGTSFSGNVQRGVRAEVVDRETGADKGIRLIKREENAWQVTKG